MNSKTAMVCRCAYSRGGILLGPWSSEACNLHAIVIKVGLQLGLPRWISRVEGSGRHVGSFLLESAPLRVEMSDPPPAG
jgi:hypothetical protein